MHEGREDVLTCGTAEGLLTRLWPVGLRCCSSSPLLLLPLLSSELLGSSVTAPAGWAITGRAGLRWRPGGRFTSTAGAPEPDAPAPAPAPAPADPAPLLAAPLTCAWPSRALGSGASSSSSADASDGPAPSPFAAAAPALPDRSLFRGMP